MHSDAGSVKKVKIYFFLFGLIYSRQNFNLQCLAKKMLYEKIAFFSYAGIVSRAERDGYLDYIKA